MNKKRVNDWILPAKEAIVRFGISNEKGQVVKTFRGQISSFGAAVVMGSLKSAVAFFSADGEASVERTNLVRAMYYVIEKKDAEPKEIFEYICRHDTALIKEKFIDASLAVKLALNFFELVEPYES